MQAWFHRLVQHVDDFDMCFLNTVVNMVPSCPDTVIALFDLAALLALIGTFRRATHLFSQEFYILPFLLLSEIFGGVSADLFKAVLRLW